MLNKDEPFDMTDISFVKRVAIGTSDPAKLRDEDYMQRQTQLLNRCLSERPRGHIIGQEKNFSIIRLGEQQVVIQSVVYHIGFKRKPMWLESENI